MRNTSKDTEIVSEIWRWIHNNIPGEPKTEDGPLGVTLRLLREGEEAKRELARLRSKPRG